MISELLICINFQVLFRTFKLAVVAKKRGIFFFWLLVTVCWLWWIMHNFDKNDNNYWIESDDFHFFNFNLILLLISYDFRVIDFYQCPGCSELLIWLLWLKYEVFFFWLLVTVCWLWWIMHHFDKNDNNYWNESDDFHFFNFNLILLLISYDFRAIDLYQLPGFVPNF